MKANAIYKKSIDLLKTQSHRNSSGFCQILENSPESRGITTGTREITAGARNILKTYIFNEQYIGKWYIRYAIK